MLHPINMRDVMAKKIQLPYREIRPLYEIDEFPLAEIAARYGVHPSTIRRILVEGGTTIRVPWCRVKGRPRLVIVDGEKKCSKCTLSKPLGDFYETRFNRMGYWSWCKLCKLERDKEYRAEQRSKRGRNTP